MFGMGTGGSLRLLSPERSGAPASRCRAERRAFHHSRFRLPAHVSSAIQLPPDFLLWLPLRFGSALALPRLQLKVLAPSKPHRLEALVRPTKAFPFPPSTLSHKPSRFAWIVFASSPFASSPLGSLASFNSTLHSPHSFQDQALDRLVSPSSTRYRASTDDLSTLSSSRGLTCLMQWQFYSLGGLHA